MNTQASHTKPAIQKYKAKVSQHTLLAGKYQYIYLELLDPHRINFKAGQYLIMTIPGSNEKKSYSIASPPVKNHGVDILVDISPQGEGSLYLSSLSPGEEIEFMAPAGQFYVTDEKNQKKNNNLIFIATGSGISPIRSMILDQLEFKADKRQIKLHWGMRYAKDLYWQYDFDQLKKSYSNFDFDIVLSKPPKFWPLCQGRVTDCLKTHKIDFLSSDFYLCGNRNMIEDITNFLLKNNTPKQAIHTEKFY